MIITYINGSKSLFDDGFFPSTQVDQDDKIELKW